MERATAEGSQDISPSGDKKIKSLGGIKVMPVSFQMPTLRSREPTSPITADPVPPKPDGNCSVEQNHGKKNGAQNVQDDIKSRTLSQGISANSIALDVRNGFASNQKCSNITANSMENYLISNNAENLSPTSNRRNFSASSKETKTSLNSTQNHSELHNPDDDKLNNSHKAKSSNSEKTTGIQNHIDVTANSKISRLLNLEDPLDEEETTESERDYAMDYERCRAQRVSEQTRADLERRRLDEILAMCSEFEREQQRTAEERKRRGSSGEVSPGGKGLPEGGKERETSIGGELTNEGKRILTKDVREELASTTAEALTGYSPGLGFVGDKTVEAAVIPCFSSASGKIKTNGSLTSPVHSRRKNVSEASSYAAKVMALDAAASGKTIPEESFNWEAANRASAASTWNGIGVSGVGQAPPPPQKSGMQLTFTHTLTVRQGIDQHRTSDHGRFQLPISDEGCDSVSPSAANRTLRSKSAFARLHPVATSGYHDYDDVFAGALSDSSDCLSDDVMLGGGAGFSPLSGFSPDSGDGDLYCLLGARNQQIGGVGGVKGGEGGSEGWSGMEAVTKATSLVNCFSRQGPGEVQTVDAASDCYHSEQASGMDRVDKFSCSGRRLHKASISSSTSEVGVIRDRRTRLQMMEDKAVNEMESAWEALEAELTQELGELRLEEDRMEVIKEQQMELLLQAAREREETRQQIAMEKRELEQRERQHEDTCLQLAACSPPTSPTHPPASPTHPPPSPTKSAAPNPNLSALKISSFCANLSPRSSGLDPSSPEPDAGSSSSGRGTSTPGPSPAGPGPPGPPLSPGHPGVGAAADLQALLRQEREALDTQRKLFEDLEFHLLELETRREEEREPLQTKLSLEHSQLMQNQAQRQIRLQAITQQKQNVLRAFQAEVREFELERRLLVQSLVQHGLSEEFSDRLRLQSCRPTKLLRDLIGVETDPSAFSTSRADLAKQKSLTLGAGSEHLKPSAALSQAAKRSHSLCVRPTKHMTARGAESNGVAKASSSDSNNYSLNGSFDSSFSFSSDVTCDERDYLTTNGNGLHVEEYQVERQASNDQAARRAMIAKSCFSQPRSSSSCVDVKMRDRKEKVQSRPMTRYLPIRESTLDLRQFIELSGHSLEPSRALVSLTPTSCRGFLTKMAGRFRTWHKRWFVFDRERHGLAYYADRAETKQRRNIAFRAIEDVFVDHLRTVKSPNPSWTFCLKTVDRVYFLVAPSAEAMRIWIDVLFTGAEGYQEFV